MTVRRAVLAVTLVLAGCAGGPQVAQPEPDAGEATVDEGTPTPAAAPWSGVRLSRDAVPSVYVSEWSKAGNRSSCALIAPVRVDESGATPRAATFSGGWAVAYDMPGLRSAFGVAGAGTSADGDVYDAWPHRVTWSDGSTAGYGPEGGTGPNQLAYLEIGGQDCLYNVWSRLGVAHLESLLDRLRFVETD